MKTKESKLSQFAEKQVKKLSTEEQTKVVGQADILIDDDLPLSPIVIDDYLPLKPVVIDDFFPF